MKQLQFPLNVNVTGNGGAYTTQTLAGLRASCTHSSGEAVRGLVKKLEAQQGLKQGDLAHHELDAKGLGPGKSVWRIERRGA